MHTFLCSHVWLRRPMAPRGDSIQPHRLLEELSKPGRDFDHTDMRHAQKLGVLFCEFLRQRFQTFVRDRVREPLAMSWCNDPTPLSSRARFKFEEGGEVFVREGGRSQEYLIQRVWCFDLKKDAAVFFCPPQVMADKSAATHFAALRGLWKFPVECGVSSLNVSHGVWDRGIFSSQFRLFFQEHQRSCEEVASTMGGGEGLWLKLLSWCVGNGCCDHDCHGSLHRAFAAEMGDKNLMKEVYKQFVAVRSGFALLVTHVQEWIAAHIAYRDWSLPREAQEQLWRLLGVAPDVTDLLLFLEMRFEDGLLCVAAKHANNPRIIRLVTKVQLKVWQFRAWTESRWLSIGPSARTLVVSVILGLDKLVRFCIDTKGCSKYHLGGFQPTVEVKGFLGAIAISSFVSETPLGMFMEDDRLALVYPAVEEEIRLEVEALNLVRDDVWATLADHMECDPGDFRDRAVRAGHAQASYLLWRLSDARDLPWRLCMGDRKANLRALAAGPRPADLGCSAKIWDLARLDCPEEILLEGLDLLANLSFSSKRVEEGHVQASRLSQMHRRLGVAAMVVRAQIGQARPLIARSDGDKQLARIEQRIATLRKKSPHKVGAKQMYMGRMIGMAKEKAVRRPGGAGLSLDTWCRSMATCGINCRRR